MLQIGGCRVSWWVAGDVELQDLSVGYLGHLTHPLGQAGCPRWAPPSTCCSIGDPVLGLAWGQVSKGAVVLGDHVKALQIPIILCLTVSSLTPRPLHSAWLAADPTCQLASKRAPQPVSAGVCAGPPRTPQEQRVSLFVTSHNACTHWRV